MRKKIVAGNWKMNLTFDEGQKLTSEIVNMYKDEAMMSFWCSILLFLISIQ